MAIDSRVDDRLQRGAGSESWQRRAQNWEMPLAVATACCVFAIYLNAPAVAVRFHHIPAAIVQLTLVPLLASAAYYVFLRRDGVIVTAALPWLVAFLAVQLVSSLLSASPAVSWKTVKTTAVEGLVLYMTVTNAIRSTRGLRYAIWALLAAGAVMGSLSMVQKTTGTYGRNYGGFAQVSAGDGFFVERDRGAVRQRRLAGPIGEQNRYAQFMLVLLPIGAMCLTATEPRWGKSLVAVATLLTAVGAALAFSRGGAVGFALMLMIAGSLGLVRPKHLLVLVLMGGAGLMVTPEYRSRLSTLVTPLLAGGQAGAEPDAAIRGRATSMLATFRMWQDHPLLGVGPGLSQWMTRDYGLAGGMRSLEGHRRAHSLYLELAAEQGIIGALCFFMIMVRSCQRLLAVGRGDSQRNTSSLAMGMLLAVTCYLTTSLFLHFSYVRYFWLLLAIADAIPGIALHARSEHEMVAVDSLVTRGEAAC